MSTDGPAIKLVLKRDSRIENREMSKLMEFDTDSYSLFIFAINSPSTREKCVLSLEYTDDFFIVSLRIRQTQYKVDSSDNNLVDEKSNNTPKDANVNI